MKRLLITLLLVTSSVGFSQDLTGYEKILLPVAVEFSALPGANGSLWQTDVSITNRSATAAEVHRAVFDCHLLCPPWTSVYPGQTLSPPLILKEKGNPSAFLFVEPGRSADVTIALRVQDISRQSETWGTSVPVVREDALFLDRIDLIGLPSSDEFRSLLRVYEFDAAPTPSSVRIRLYAYKGGVTSKPDPVVFDHEFTFVRTGDSSPNYEAGFIQFPLPRFENLGATDRLRIEITPLSPGLRFWGFVSVVHNVTQHLTVITPSQ